MLSVEHTHAFIVLRADGAVSFASRAVLPPHPRAGGDNLDGGDHVAALPVARRGWGRGRVKMGR